MQDWSCSTPEQLWHIAEQNLGTSQNADMTKRASSNGVPWLGNQFQYNSHDYEATKMPARKLIKVANIY